jgi:hypothetical protein
MRSAASNGMEAGERESVCLNWVIIRVCMWTQTDKQAKHGGELEGNERASSR